MLAASMMTETDHAPSVEGQAKVVDEGDVGIKSFVEEEEVWESKDDWELWGTQEDHDSFMELTLPFIPEPRDSHIDHPPPVPDSTTPVNKRVGTPDGVTDQGEGHPLMEGTKSPPRGFPNLATTPADGVASIDPAEDDAHFARLEVVEQGAVDKPGRGLGAGADILIGASDDPQSATKSPGARGEEDKTCSPEFTAVVK